MNGTPKMAARHVTGSLVIPFLGMLLMPAILQAQACIGSHASPREAAIAAVATFADDMAAVGGELAVFPTGSIFLGTGLLRGNFGPAGESGSRLRSRLGAEVYRKPVSICFQARATYTSRDAAASQRPLKLYTVQAGIGAGTTVGTSVLITPYASASAVSSWTRRVGTFGGVDFNGVSPETGGLFTVGVSVGNRRLYAGPSITISTIQGADAVLIVRTAIVL